MSKMEIRSVHRQILDALCEQAHKFYELRYQMSNGGNLSARIPGSDYMLVKGTDVDFQHVSYDTLVVCDFSGNVVEGTIRPSKESLLHGAIYEHFPAVRAILHCHSVYATAWAQNHGQLEFSTHHSSIKLKGYCPVFDTDSYVVPQEYFPVILGAFEKHPGMNSFLLRRHGQVALGKNIQEAAGIAELVEETAQIALLSRLCCEAAGQCDAG